jgi:hypothetical protein
MKIAYLIFAYKNPCLIKRTIERLKSENCAFFIHIDAKIDIGQFSEICGENVFFTKQRVMVHWAEFSGNEAILLLMREALARAERYDYLVLLSGSEYPLRSSDYIEDFFERNRGAEFMTLSKMPAPGKPLSRLNTIRYPSTKPVRRFIFRALAKIGLAKRDYRKYFGGLEPYSGITWWALSREACQYLVEFRQQNGGLAAFFEKAFAPEETYFHTILANSPFGNRMRRSLLFEDWSAGGAHPAMINEQHIAAFQKVDEVSKDDLHGPGELLFARKFSDETSHLLDLVDEMIDHKDRSMNTEPAVAQSAVG